MNTHWTEESTEDFVYKMGFDFARQVEEAMDAKPISRSGLAKRVGVGRSRVSQVLNDPGNLSFEVVVKYARALGKKAALVMYDDGDSSNKKGPIPSGIFEQCWKRAGMPRDFMESETSLRGRTQRGLFAVEDRTTDRISSGKVQTTPKKPIPSNVDVSEGVMSYVV